MSRANESKHGVDFAEAQRLWAAPDLLVVPASPTDEARFLVVGRIDGVHWSAITTHRAGRMRIISVRRSRREKIQLYEG